MFSEYLMSLYKNSTKDIENALTEKSNFKQKQEKVIKGIYKSEDKLTEVLGG
jgi:hypothetical protein